jgi:endonuclease/exonuclease/phosphatase family metal-dependent hydrolase
VRNANNITIGTYNIHSGSNEFYHFDLEAVARTIQQSGADAVLLQQVESGRLTSFGVDEPLWLARRLGMDTRFFPTNEGLQGLAVLSRVEIVFDDGNLLSSASNQTGLQRVQIRPDEGVITLYNTWLGFLLETGDGTTIEEQEQDQQRQLNQIFTLISAQHPDGNLGRTVMGGTFNNIPSSALADQMRQANFTDPFAGLPIELSATFVRVNYPPTRLDYLWLRSLNAFGVNVIDSAASDHRLAVVGVEVTRQGQ